MQWEGGHLLANFLIDWIYRPRLPRLPWSTPAIRDLDYLRGIPGSAPWTPAGRNAKLSRRLISDEYGCEVC